jgi:type III restriction enzyme
MSRQLDIDFDADLLDAISTDFDLRKPNKAALRKLVYTLNDEYDPNVMQVVNMATGVGKTYLMAAFIEYLRLQGISNVVIVTPGKTVQAKTVMNFREGSSQYIAGSPVPPEVVTPQDYSAWVARSNGPGKLAYGRDVPVLAFVFNIQQLIAPKSDEGATHGKTEQAMRRKPRKFDENAGVLFDYLKQLDDLVVIADESHLYSSTAEAFNSALRELDPAACIGLTATATADDHVIYRYPLYEAIQDEYVKAPVLAFRKSGYKDDVASEEQQLSDAVQLRQIKQEHYDLYCGQHMLPHLNAVLFVVCADTDHATQVSELLRTQRYFNSQLAVLQVDSNHDDDTTQRMLEELDTPDSPVLAVVSVNKLKEGWDVKNIAVVVTLRAMASEVLTQQTMGRGLRLPFGRYTHVLQIDQLDIISHQSFVELLSAENVLAQFGLEDAVAESDQDAVSDAIKAVGSGDANETVYVGGHNVQSSGANESGWSSVDGTAVTDAGQPHQSSFYDNGCAPSVGVRNMEGLPEEQGALALVRVDRAEAFKDVSYYFPCTQINVREAPMLLSDIDERLIREAAGKVTSTGDVLIRKEIVAALGGKLKAVDTESAEVDSIHLDQEDVEKALTRLVVSGGLITVTEQNALLARDYLVRKFMQNVPFENWTVKSLASATEELRKLVRSFADEVLRHRVFETVIVPHEMPHVDHLMVSIGDKIHEPISSQNEFVRSRFYSGWFKSLFEAESFDSYTGEYLLAKLLNTSPHIKWWQRLHPQEGAYIYYTPKDRYFPDFVALDDDDVHWIIEGKDQRGVTDAKVQAKRKAAEGVVHRLIGEDSFKGQKWGYLVAYEESIKSADSWDDLKAVSEPISNA